MQILVIGASSGIGLETVKSALSSGYRVRAISRSVEQLPLAHPLLDKQKGDALNPADIRKCIAGVDAVIQTLGIKVAGLCGPVHLFSGATRILLPAMQQQGVRRLIAVTGFGAGDSRDSISFLERLPFNLFLGRAYKDKDSQERLIKESELDWTIVRPGILINGPAQQRFNVLAEPHEWRNGIITRADVADFLLQEVCNPKYVHRCPVLVN